VVGSLFTMRWRAYDYEDLEAAREQFHQSSRI
jgi:hypothetical protein